MSATCQMWTLRYEGTGHAAQKVSLPAQGPVTMGGVNTARLPALGGLSTSVSHLLLEEMTLTPHVHPRLQNQQFPCCHSLSPMQSHMICLVPLDRQMQSRMCRSTHEQTAPRLGTHSRRLCEIATGLHSAHAHRVHFYMLVLFQVVVSVCHTVCCCLYTCNFRPRLCHRFIRKSV